MVRSMVFFFFSYCLDFSCGPFRCIVAAARRLLSPSPFCCHVGTAALHDNKMDPLFFSRSLWRGVCRDVGPAPTLAIITWAVGFWWGVCRDVGPAPTLAIITWAVGFWRGVCRDVGPAPTLAIITRAVGFWQGVCRDVGPAPTLAITSVVGWALRSSK